VAERAKAVAIKADFGRNDGDGGGLALRAVHGYTSEIKASGQHKRNKRGSSVDFNLLRVAFQELLCKNDHKNLKSTNFGNLVFIIQTNYEVLPIFIRILTDWQATGLRGGYFWVGLDRKHSPPASP
jgi:hypothetical protein